MHSNISDMGIISMATPQIEHEMRQVNLLRNYEIPKDDYITKDEFL